MPIVFHLEDAASMYTSLLNTVLKDVYGEQLRPKDIMIIDMDQLSYTKNYDELMKYLETIQEDRDDLVPKVRIHTAGAMSPEDFFRDRSIVYTGIRRAKGNEAYMVYIVNAQKCFNTIQRRTDRNALFTAITRSKGWVRVYGYGEDMRDLCNEFNVTKEQGFRLHFDHYPTAEEQQSIFLNNRDADYHERRSFEDTKQLINRLTQAGTMSKVELMKQLFDADRDELLKLLMDTENEQT